MPMKAHSPSYETTVGVMPPSPLWVCQTSSISTPVSVLSFTYNVATRSMPRRPGVLTCVLPVGGGVCHIEVAPGGHTHHASDNALPYHPVPPSHGVSRAVHFAGLEPLTYFQSAILNVSTSIKFLAIHQFDLSDKPSTPSRLTSLGA